jgi:acyl-CoA reductase-like NAD-dependent aldehyde dehydrogenase
MDIPKTYKMYIGGKFPRTESGRYYKVIGRRDALVANACRASRKDLRNAVVAARRATGDWARRSAYNRGQILYRIAEMLDGRRDQFAAELYLMGASKAAADKEVTAAVDRLVYYAGWADKFQQVFSSVNPVNSSHFNFTIMESTGVVAITAPEQPALLGLVAALAPAICGGNTVVVLASESRPLCASTFAEVLQSSDVPGGVVNILTGMRDEIVPHMASHLDINALVCYGEIERKAIQEAAAENVKRVIFCNDADCKGLSPYAVLDLQEAKTTWHPVGI